MKKSVLLISITCLCAAFATAQKTVRKRQKVFIQASVEQASGDSIQKKSSQFDTPLKILDKPRAPRADGQDCSQGKVVLRVTFLDSGKIGTISVISALTRSNTESAIDAATKIKFMPAVKRGKPVTVSKIVEYIFTIY